MGLIKKLPPQVVNQIAAGEVVERPASIVKELLENALDAGSTHIEVVIEDGGLSKIETKDNGKGIAKNDLLPAVERFATSKLTDISDLESIETYGFRGEALASIGAVSNLKLTSREKNSELAYSITVSHGEVSDIVPAARSIGTTIEITDLFSKIPARKKFLKSKETEFKYIAEVFQNAALIRPDVHFSLRNNGKLVYDLTVETDTMGTFGTERVMNILKIEKEQISPINHFEFGTGVYGYVLNPKYLNEYSRFLKIFINGRPIEDKGISRSLQKGISQYVPPVYKVSAIINITTDRSQVDVNVHPRKTEVKFLNPFRIYSTVQNAVEQALKSAISEEMGIPQGVLPKSSYLSKNMSENWDSQSEKAYDRLRGTRDTTYLNGNNTYTPQRQSNTSLSFFTDDSPAYITNTSSPSIDDTNESQVNPQNNEKTRLERTTSQQTLLHVYPVLGRYIIAEWESEVWFVDQHAAAERIRFEALKKSYLFGESLPEQKLLLPIKVVLSVQEQSTAKTHEEVFRKLGLSIGLQENELLVHSVPTFLQQSDLERIIRESLGEMMELDNIGVMPDVSDFISTKDISLVIATMACHNSIRMNERISAVEAKSLIDDLLKCDIPYSCPHGRRIVWILDTESLDKNFMRDRF